MNFISETQVEENKRVRGERVEDGTGAADRPLYEILKEAKEKKEAEQKEKFRNLPPKALDEEEMEFLDIVEKHRREQERAARDAEKVALEEFHTALLSRTIRVEEPLLRMGPAARDSVGVEGEQDTLASGSVAAAAQPPVLVTPATAAAAANAAEGGGRGGGAGVGAGGLWKKRPATTQLPARPKIAVVVQPKKQSTKPAAAAAAAATVGTRNSTGAGGNAGAGACVPGQRSNNNEPQLREGDRGGGEERHTPARASALSGAVPAPPSGKACAPADTMQPSSTVASGAPEPVSSVQGLAGLLGYGSGDDDEDEDRDT